MAYNLKFEEQCRIVHALAEDASIRSLERQTGHHRDTIMRLGVRVGRGCAAIHDEIMRDLPCKEIQIDELWSFCGKKQRGVTSEQDAGGHGDRWIFTAEDPESKVIASYAVGKRDFSTTYRFCHDLASRLKNRIQLTSDGNNEYIDVVQEAFGSDGVDYSMLVKSFTHEKSAFGDRKSSPPPMTSARRKLICGEPEPDRISTSHVEAHNMTMRTFIKRISRLTVCYSKKSENMDAAVALYMGYYNFCKEHTTIKMTPAMALGIQPSFWSIEELVDRALKKCPTISQD